jgi:hypothetical protein
LKRIAFDSINFHCPNQKTNKKTYVPLSMDPPPNNHSLPFRTAEADPNLDLGTVTADPVPRVPYNPNNSKNIRQHKFSGTYQFDWEKKRHEPTSTQMLRCCTSKDH